MGIVRIVGTAAAAGVATAAIRRRVDGVRQVRRSVAEYRAHWQELAASHAGDDVALRYVALGDSAAQGVGASSPDAGYVPALARAIASRTSRDVALYNLSVSGAKARDVLADQLPRLADLGFTPDVLTLGIGGNDVVDRRISVEAFLASMAEVLAGLPPGSFVADPPGFLIPPFEGRSDAMALGVRPLIREAGHHLVALHRATRSAGHLGWVRNVAADAFHPNDRGYAGWAAAFIEALDAETPAPQAETVWDQGSTGGGDTLGGILGHVNHNAVRRLLILGAGTAGTITANKLRAKLPSSEWEIRVVAKNDIHDYKPSYLFIPFGMNKPTDARRSAHAFLRDGIIFDMGDVDVVKPEEKVVTLTDGRDLSYDKLVIATGAHIRPDMTEGTLSDEWHKSVGEFYSLEGAIALKERLEAWKGGRLVMHFTEVPIMCPVAPLEFVLLADSWLRKRGLRDATEIVFVTPLDGAFTKPVASKILGSLLEDRNITVETDFMIEHIDAAEKKMVSYDEREIPFDQLVTVPLNMGAEFVERSGLGDELNFVKVDKHTMQHTEHPDIFALGDAANLPTSKAGAVAHFSIDVFVENFLQLAAGKPMTHKFDGHANCFIESGDNKAMLLDFNYETEPLPGKFPVAGVGPLTLLEESVQNHLSKLAFRWVYWNMLIPGRPIPLAPDMSMAGKKTSV